MAQQLRRAVFDHDFGFKIQPGRKAEIFVEWPREAVNAPMLAAAVRINAGLEPDVRAVVIVDDGAGIVPVELGARRRIVLWIPIHIALQFNLLETICGIAPRAAM